MSRFIRLTTVEKRQIHVDADRIAWFAPDDFRGTAVTMITMADLSGGKGDVFGPQNIRVLEDPEAILLLLRTSFS